MARLAVGIIPLRGLILEGVAATGAAYPVELRFAEQGVLIGYPIGSDQFSLFRWWLAILEKALHLSYRSAKLGSYSTAVVAG